MNRGPGLGWGYSRTSGQ